MDYEYATIHSSMIPPIDLPRPINLKLLRPKSQPQVSFMLYEFMYELLK